LRRAAIALSLLAVLVVFTVTLRSGNDVTSADEPDAGPYSSELAGTALSDEEVRANEYLSSYGVRIDRTNGTFELRGDILALQDAYLDRECRAKISPAVADKIRLFQLGMNRQTNACLRQKGYPAPDKDDQLYFEGVPLDVQNSCLDGVHARYR
jgi:hypothetical protein